MRCRNNKTKYFRWIVFILLASNISAQLKITSVKIIGSKYFDENMLKSKLESFSNKEYSQNIIDEDIEQILKFYDINGFPFAKIKLTELRIDSLSKTVEIKYLVDEDLKTYVKEIRFSGNRITKNYVLERESSHLKNKIYNQNEIDKIPVILKRKYLISNHEQSELFIIPNFTDSIQNNVGINFDIREGKYSTIDGVIGYAPNKTGGGNFAGMFYFSTKNLIGTARVLEIKWERENEFTQEVNFLYKEPWIFNYPIDLGVQLLQRKQDSTFARIKFEIFIQTFQFSYFDFQFKLSSDEVFPLNDEKYFTSFHSRSVGGVAKIIYDDWINNKIYFSTSISEKRKNILGPNKYLNISHLKDFTQRESEIEFRYENNIYSNYYFHEKFILKNISSSQYEFSDYYYFGGAKNMRGYRENQFYGSTVASLQNEFHLRIERESSIYLFTDFGYYSKNGDIVNPSVQKNENLFGYGFGIALPTAVGKINIAFALAKREVISDAKLHLNISNEF